jgi:hypothetical protein
MERFYTSYIFPSFLYQLIILKRFVLTKRREKQQQRKLFSEKNLPENQRTSWYPIRSKSVKVNHCSSCPVKDIEHLSR